MSELDEMKTTLNEIIHEVNRIKKRNKLYDLIMFIFKVTFVYVLYIISSKYFIIRKEMNVSILMLTFIILAKVARDVIIKKN